MIENLKTKIFLKKIGFLPNTNHTQLDNRLLKSLSTEEQITLKKVWEDNYYGVGKSLNLYSIPQNLKQACLLFSHDYNRIEKSLNWIANEIMSSNVKSAMEMGCGFGILLKFLKEIKPEADFMGIDYASNLVKIGRELTDIDLIDGSYLDLKPTLQYDTIICDFGFDMDNLKIPNRDCQNNKIGNIEYCINCTNDFKKAFFPYINSWKKWSSDQSQLIITGRMSANRSFMLAFLELCNEHGWNLNTDKVAVLKTYDKQMAHTEKFLALSLKTKKENKVHENFELIVNMLDD